MIDIAERVSSVSQSSGQSLHFSINESVWLTEGEEAEEILSMALEPDITIEENLDYVSIKGALRLTGEYKPLEQENEDNESVEADGRFPFRTIDEITETDVGTALMEHRFPVDITIPTGRIADIDDIYVTVESFDYQLPERGCIQLEADISISGLVDESQAKEPSVQETEPDAFEPGETAAYEAYRTPDTQGAEADAPQVDMKERQDDDEQEEDWREPVEWEDEREPDHDVEAFSESEAVPEVDRADNEEEVVGRIEIEDEEEAEPALFRNGPVFDEEQEAAQKITSGDSEVGRYEKKKLGKFKTVGPIGGKKKKEKPEEKEEAEHPFYQEETETIPVVNEYEEEEMIEEKKAEKKKGKAHKSQSKRQDENALYLTKMLTNEGDPFTQVRMCIVQNGESLESISERYKVPITSILRRNRLDSDMLEEGQVLYIPVSNKG